MVGVRWRYSNYTTAEGLRVPVWSRCPELWQKAIDHWLRGQPNDGDVFIHRDYHPVNVLWRSKGNR